MVLKGKNTVISLLTTLILFVLIFKSSIVDGLVLLEKTQPVYVNFINHGRNISFSALLEGITEEQLNETNILSNKELNNFSYIGLNAQSDGGELIINGCTPENHWTTMTKDYYLWFEDGIYLVSSGNKKDPRAFITAYQEGQSNKITFGEEYEYLIVDNDSCDRYKYTLAIRGNSNYENVIYKPMITKISDDKREKFDMYQVYICNIQNITRDEITDKELQLIERYIKANAGEWEWCSIIFGNSEGVQFNNDRILYGKLDGFGRIVETY